MRGNMRNRNALNCNKNINFNFVVLKFHVTVEILNSDHKIYRELSL